MTTNIHPQDTQYQQSAPAPGKKPFYKRVWFIILAIVVFIAIAVGATGGDEDAAEAADENTAVTAPASPDADDADDAVAVEDDAPAPESRDVPREHQSALRKAETYSEMMHMSKAGILEQLTSDYGEGFSPEAARYAVDNVDADWNNNALEKARTYQDTMSMSPSAIHEQLVSEYGEKFTVEEADYALAHLDQ
ncbi:Ltp family lipoprotein [Corynebacterium glyciniphilum]|uniref:Ltp family lipoprotein n=1 Tax=Corynebacterium glyciniphilum TaxID=1404244 RepID=UPI0026501E5D|nr:Ltp family lipoprotein [Corynebacterium glyciniphilum]MDN5682541.1 Ltp family lipoprotein [Corynebacterium glyciniphilum]